MLTKKRLWIKKSLKPKRIKLKKEKRLKKEAEEKAIKIRKKELKS